eukprot:960188-Prymnesium_polylepis.1
MQPIHPRPSMPALSSPSSYVLRPHRAPIVLPALWAVAMLSRRRTTRYVGRHSDVVLDPAEELARAPEPEPVLLALQLPVARLRRLRTKQPGRVSIMLTVKHVARRIRVATMMPRLKINRPVHGHIVLR